MLVFIPTFTVGLVDTIIAKTWLRREYIYILRNIRCGFFLLALWFADVDPPISDYWCRKVDDLPCRATLLRLLHAYILLCWNGRYAAPL